MPTLNGDQFRLFDPGPAQHGPRREEGVPMSEPTAVPQSHAAGQVVMNLDDPVNPTADSRRITGRGGIVPVTERDDPAWSMRGFDIGGGRRDSPYHAGRWESLPVETIPAGSEIRTGQVFSGSVGTGKQDDGSGRAYRKHGAGHEELASMVMPRHDESHIDDLKRSTSFSNDQFRQGSYQHRAGDEKKRWPWIIETQTGDATQRYVVEGNHRTAAMRERGTGEVRAHVMRGEPGQNVNDIVDKFSEDHYEHVRQKKQQRQAEKTAKIKLL